MNIYLLSRSSDSIGYDEYDAHLVRANNVEEARELCIHGDEGAKAWQEADVAIITVSGEPELIISSFNAG